MTTVDAEVIAANEAFYAAFTRYDSDAMDAVWARRTAVACIHPGHDALRGRELVMASWRAILGSGRAPRIRCADASAHVVGEMAFVVCHELIGGGRLVATNVFVQEDGRWRIAHHQAGPLPPLALAADDPDSDENTDEDPAPPRRTLN